MNGQFSAGPPACAGGGTRRGRWGRWILAAVAALLLFLGALCPPAPAATGGDAGRESRSFEQRATAEKSSRSRFRRLEVASFVLILVGGAAVTLWAIRRK